MRALITRLCYARRQRRIYTYIDYKFPSQDSSTPSGNEIHSIIRSLFYTILLRMIGN